MASPAPSLLSTSSQLREVHGRAFNSSVETYLLPADDEEQNRLDLQHNALVCFLGGLFPWPDRVNEALRPRPGYTPGILDIGTAYRQIKDFDSFLYNLAEVLRPGGVLILGSGDPQFYDENVKALPIVSEGQPG
ncbi:hypothetical protein FS837_008078 [Tulasnella sp. UAMH 9824]|nr:hypothetical protein FS837_008078 [Tulasnella sp. UAMH 9824]